jgi:hypothetical protein
MARRERREQPRLPIEVEVLLNPRTDGDRQPVLLTLRTRNLNIRGAFLELPECKDPQAPWVQADWWAERRVIVHLHDSPLAPGQELSCEGQVRWVERRGPKRRAVGIGILFLLPSEQWLVALRSFLDSLVT